MLLQSTCSLENALLNKSYLCCVQIYAQWQTHSIWIKKSRLQMKLARKRALHTSQTGNLSTWHLGSRLGHRGISERSRPAELTVSGWQNEPPSQNNQAWAIDCRRASSSSPASRAQCCTTAWSNGLASLPDWHIVTASWSTLRQPSGEVNWNSTTKREMRLFVQWDMGFPPRQH